MVAFCFSEFCRSSTVPSGVAGPISQVRLVLWWLLHQSSPPALSMFALSRCGLLVVAPLSPLLAPLLHALASTFAATCSQVAK